METVETFNRFFGTTEEIAKENFINGKRDTIMSVEEFNKVFND